MNLKTIPFKRILFALIIMVSITPILMAQQQNLTRARASQHAIVMQTIGFTKMKIDYHGPLVKGRTIWGKLVPYNDVWRGGANENTIIYFGDDVTVNGKTLSKGKYGLHLIPSKTEWTIIFSKTYWSWGSYSYDQKEDALRIKVKPESVPFQEWLSYSFDNPTSNSVVASMRWEKLKISFKIEIDQHKLALENFRKQLRSVPRFFWQGWNQAANYSLANKVNLKEAMQWADRSIGINKNFTNLSTKAGLLKLMGKNKEAKTMKKNALKIANEAQLNVAGYQLMNANKVDEAIELFKLNVKRHPKSWNVYDSLADALLKNGDNKGSKENYEKALSMVKDDANKKRITKTLKSF
ncbi:MAG: DUF2911 domain-containing protein [Bacteroidetes bacterium]|nr:DUF2911 domain-containing protein [Bacteroidota bacterium]